MGMTIEQRLRCLELAAAIYEASEFRRDAEPEDEIYATAKRLENYCTGRRMTVADILNDLMGD